MSSIRIKIFLLTFFSLFFLLFAIVNIYLEIKQNVLDSKKSLKAVEKISYVSELIHSLQRERGLTAMHLVKDNNIFYEKLTKQRKITDVKLLNIKNSSIFKDEINKMRTIVDNNKSIEWKIIKEFYAYKIDKLLTKISLDLAELGYQEKISHQLYAVIYLLKARENLGILRAEISRSYEKTKLSQNEILDISAKYSLFINKFHYFESHISKTPSDDINKQLNEGFLKPIKSKVISIIEKENTQQISSSVIWWKDATTVIDLMKEVENTLFDRIKEYSISNIQANERNLFSYITAVLVALFLIGILAISTIVRILKALSALTNHLKRVEQTQDYTLRISAKSNDEFDKLNSSVNKFLAYTDSVVKEKEKLASVDLLTGVMNRRSFIIIAEKAIEQSNRYKRPLSLIFCDLDHFKLINDNYGHNIGDKVLKIFAHTVSSHIRKSDYIVRWGGEEFIILTPETNKKQASILAQNLKQMVSELCIEEIKNLTCSFGVAEIKENESLQDLYKRADEAMYRAKELGRNQVCVDGNNI